MRYIIILKVNFFCKFQHTQTNIHYSYFKSQLFLYIPAHAHTHTTHTHTHTHTHPHPHPHPPPPSPPQPPTHPHTHTHCHTHTHVCTCPHMHTDQKYTHWPLLHFKITLWLHGGGGGGKAQRGVVVIFAVTGYVCLYDFQQQWCQCNCGVFFRSWKRCFTRRERLRTWWRPTITLRTAAMMLMKWPRHWQKSHLLNRKLFLVSHSMFAIFHTVYIYWNAWDPDEQSFSPKNMHTSEVCWCVLMCVILTCSCECDLLCVFIVCMQTRVSTLFLFCAILHIIISE